jgi:hypothetical protein
MLVWVHIIFIIPLYASQLNTIESETMAGVIGQKPGMAIYSKRFALEQRLLAEYADKSVKMVWFERFGEGKCFLTKGQPTKNYNNCLYKTVVQRQNVKDRRMSRQSRSFALNTKLL